MSGSSIHMMEDAEQAELAYQQGLDQQQMRDEEINKLLTIYIGCAVEELKDCYTRAGMKMPESIEGVMQASAELSVIQDKFKDIKLDN